MSSSIAAGGPERPARLLPDPRARLKRRRAVDRLVKWIVTFGGSAIILSILAILFVIVKEILPLAGGARAVDRGTVSIAEITRPLAIVSDEYRETAALIEPSGITFVSLKTGSALSRPTLSGLGEAKVASTTDPARGPFALGLSDGRILPARIKFEVHFEGSNRVILPAVTTGEPVSLGAEPIRVIAHSQGEAHSFTAALTGKELSLAAVKERKTPMGTVKRESEVRRLALPEPATCLAMDSRGNEVFAGTASGRILRISAAPLAVLETVETGGSGVSLLGFLLGDRTLVVGDDRGAVTSWQSVRVGEAGTRMMRMHKFEPHDGPVTGFSVSQRDKGFITVGGRAAKLHYGTTGKTLAEVPSEGIASTFAPKANALLMAGTGAVRQWQIDNPHPEVSWQGLFGKLWYEGYEEPDYVWQSTGGTDDFESKFGMTKLIVGTLKGTFYAMVVAIPLALLGALYTSQFMHPTIRANIKPVVEIMAALPSVVLGFIAGLWLAPQVEKVVPGLFLSPFVVGGLILGAVWVWRRMPQKVRSRFKFGTEVFLLAPIVVAGVWLALALGSWLEAGMLQGDYRRWVLQTLGLTFDQRNSVVVGLAMGFAVIPIIFTIAEDSLSNVPPHLAAGSLALGANRWQTAVRVVLPTASPGIFSAVMIGFGRAVGETMIVLMATGNTPVMDMSPFNGFRALSANIAVELPEAAFGTTHYRVLFLSALLLFIMTFFVNTLAEVVRLRLRKKYQYL